MLIALLFLTLIYLTTSLSVNSPCHPSHHRVQNDIAIRHPQSAATSRTKRGATATKKRLWPDGIVPFSISKDFDSVVTHNLQVAMEIWQNHSCIRFVNRTDEPFGLHFERQNCGCCSFVGMEKFANGYPQGLSINGENCEDIGHMLHEIGHALGFWHEHVRPDRDRYVRVNETNIEDDRDHNFEKKNPSEINSLGEPYDYKSIMHYSAFSFALNPNRRTLKPRRRNMLIGQREKLSRGDIIQINKLYGCPADEDQCKAHKCEHHCVSLYRGYRCTCRRGYTLLPDGTSCSLQCQPWFGHSQTQGLLFSPNFPQLYETDLSCEWNLNAPARYHVTLRILKFHLEDGGESCNFDVLEVRVWVNKWRVYHRLCGKLSRPLTLSIPYNNVQIRFRSDDSVQRQGFKLFYKFTLPLMSCTGSPNDCVSNLVAPPQLPPTGNSCSKEYRTSSGVMVLPSFRPVTCTVKLKLRTLGLVKVELGDLHMAEGPGCREEHVVIRRSKELIPVARLCGSRPLQVFWIKTRLLWISYRAVRPHTTMDLRYSVVGRG